MNTKIIKFGLVILMAMVLAGGVFAQEGKKESKKEDTPEVVKVTQGEIQGEISAIGRDFIAIIYDRDANKGIEYEMLVPIDETVQYLRVKGLKELKVGDTISIKYEDSTEELDDKQALKRKAQAISFVKPAPPKPPEPQE